MIKSIFARPVFINPQAYLVIPLLANLSMLEPIDFTSTNTYSFESLGKVESKIISAKDEYILHIDLYELNGSCVLGEFYIGPATIGSIDDFTITTNGYITTIEVGGGDSGNIVYPGLIAAWSAKGKTNDDEDRAILKDLTGNGHDITLNGFAFSEMSGYGGYNYTYDNWTNTVNAEINGNVAIINGYPSTRSVLERNLGRSTPKTILRLKASIEIKNNPNKLPIRMYFTGAADYPSKSINITESGIYELPQVTSNNYEGNGYYIGFQLNNNNLMEGDENYYCRIQLLPEYPDALVFDGVDDCGNNENMPLLDDFTLIYKKHYIEIPTKENSCLFSKRTAPSLENGAFQIERLMNNNFKVYSFGGSAFVDISNEICFCTKTSYNRTPLRVGTQLDTTEFIINGFRNAIGFSYIKLAFYSAYLFDRSLDEQEIKEFIRKYIDTEYMLPSERPQYITFADPEVERICVENWSSDGIGCTLEDIQKVTSLNNKFQDNTIIKSFDELGLFNSLIQLGYNEFNGCTSLQSISIPCNIQDSPNTSYGAFKGCISLTEVNFTNDDISIGNFAFNECTSLNNISFPNNIKIIGNYTFNGCSSLSEIKNWGNISKNITQIKSYAFNSTMFSYNLELPKLEYLGNFAFARTKLKKITNLGKITIIPRCDIGLFGTSIILLTLPETLTTISAWGLVMPKTFKVLICKAVTPPEINAINNLRNAKIYVPDDSVEAYKTATNWSNYADRIHPISEYVPGEEDAE